MIPILLLTVLVCACDPPAKDTPIEMGKKTEGWVYGDGGPLIYVQSGAIDAWQGASDWDNSILNGGTVRTDYDVVCEQADGINVIHHHERDMLVLSDSSWVAKVFERRDGIFFFQSIGHDGSPEETISQAIANAPISVTNFSHVDATGRLMVGADAGLETFYDFAETVFEPGE